MAKLKWKPGERIYYCIDTNINNIKDCGHEKNHCCVNCDEVERCGNKCHWVNERCCDRVDCKTYLPYHDGFVRDEYSEDEEEDEEESPEDEY